ncbi:restriction endonuclease subunit S [Rhodospirillum sp. A1_3_36]|uniref:restriction endonuclease subunit S n=1 Tax=Rhodospirillum sp. A1_3_36 TaxID=3391666 RepID=UPI0039A77E34
MIRTTNIRNGKINLDNCRFVDASTYQRWTRRAKLVDGDVVLTREAPIGEVGFVRDMPGIFLGQRMMQYRPNPKVIDPRFLYYSFCSPNLQAQFKSHDGSGSVVSHIRVADCHKFTVPVPPLDDQCRISSVLGSLDDKIDLNRRTNETLEAMARAVFKSWFVDFDPVHAKAAGKAPAHMDPETVALFPDTFGEDGLPVGWRMEAIGEHFKALKGLSYKGSGLSDAGAPLFNLNSILEGGGYKYEGIKFYAGEFKEKHEAGPGDLLVANTEQGFEHLLIGFSALVPPSQGKGIFSHHLYKIQGRPKTHLNTTYLHFLMSVSPQGEVIRRYSNGTTVNMLPADAFERPRITVPPAGLIAAFSKFAMPIAEKQDAAVTENQTLAALRDLLLPKLMSGEIRLRDAETIVEGVA